ncbi:MAG: cytochrome c maturation protein CcmE [Pseudomonadota bacterium]|nr:cytochrome c maturation protein CcmE [Pseudomonadota bacterium]
MKPHRRRKLYFLVFLLLSSGGAIALTLMALAENINLFYSPAEIVSGVAPVNKRIRAGGMVLDGSIFRSESDLEVRFIVTDLQGSEFRIFFEGILPDLFREGQGIVARGTLNEKGDFLAEEVLAKHDENYMPPEVLDVINQSHGDALK